jgi:hypothetical protein
MHQDTDAWAAGAAHGIEKIASSAFSVGKMMQRNVGTSTRAVTGDRVLGRAQRQASRQPKVRNRAPEAAPLAQPNMQPDVAPTTMIGGMGQ